MASSTGRWHWSMNVSKAAKACQSVWKVLKHRTLGISWNTKLKDVESPVWFALGFLCFLIFYSYGILRQIMSTGVQTINDMNVHYFRLRWLTLVVWLWATAPVFSCNSCIFPDSDCPSLIRHMIAKYYNRGTLREVMPRVLISKPYYNCYWKICGGPILNHKLQWASKQLTATHGILAWFAGISLTRIRSSYIGIVPIVTRHGWAKTGKNRDLGQLTSQCMFRAKRWHSQTHASCARLYSFQYHHVRSFCSFHRKRQSSFSSVF